MSNLPLDKPIGTDSPSALGSDTHPLAYSITEFRKQAGDLGNSFLYEEIRDGKLKVRKAGRRSIVLHDEGVEYLKSLPLLKPKAAG